MFDATELLKEIKDVTDVISIHPCHETCTIMKIATGCLKQEVKSS